MAKWPCQTNPFFTMSMSENTRHEAAVSFYSRVAHLRPLGFGAASMRHLGLAEP
jgi:hypothetical protein